MHPHHQPHHRAWPLPRAAGLLSALLSTLFMAPGSAAATEPVPPGLAPLAGGWQATNPYRSNADAAAIGAAAYAQHCATCHGADSVRSVAEAPDLRRLNSFCSQLKQTELKPRCLADVDRYFLLSVREGKVRAGLRHMPAWEGVLPQEMLWAIRSFTETRPLPPPRTLPDLPPGGGPAATR